MSSFIKNNWQYIVFSVVTSFAISYGVSDFIPFYKGLCLLLPLTIVGIYYFFGSSAKDKEAEQIIQTLDGIIGEQSQVIEEYEKIFDTQLVELPCLCGGNTFQGLFSPKIENVVECEKCKNKYRVNVSYDSVLITEPLDLNKSFDDLINESH